MANGGQHEVRFRIGPDGKIIFEVKGVKGQGCRDIAAAIRKATGLKVSAERPTGEAYEAEVHCSTDLYVKK